MTPLPRSGLYAIADTGWLGADHLLEAVQGAIEGGAVMIQLRDKHAAVSGNHRKLDALLSLCREYRVPLIINDDVDLAATLTADGVHIGQRDGRPELARARLGDQAIVGVSCHDSIAAAHHAVATGADYVAFGRLFGSQTKPAAPAAKLAILEQARTELPVPIVAIGGITPDNIAAALAAGADLCAVIAGIFAHGCMKSDTRAAASRYQIQIQQYREQKGL